MIIIIGGYLHSQSNRNPENLQNLPGGVKIAEIARGWTTTEVVFNESTDLSYTPKITIDNAGNVHLAWYDHTDYNGSGTEPDNFYRLWNATMHAWSPVEVVSLEHTGSSIIPSITVDENGHVHLAWTDNTNYNGAGGDDDIFYKRWNATTGTWTPTVVVSNVSSDDSFRPQIVVDVNGHLHVVWQDITNYNGSGSDWDLFYRCWNATTDTWTVPQVVTNESTINSGQPAMAVDSYGTVHVVWRELFGGHENIFYKYWNATIKAWSGAELISTESAFDTWVPKIAVDGSKHAHVVWWEVDAYIFHKRRNATTGNWTATELVSTESSSYTVEPSITTDLDGNVHVAWRDGTNLDGAGSDGDIFYKYWNATTGNWTLTEVVSTESTGTSSKPTIAVDGAGCVHVAWEDYTDYQGAGSDCDIFYKKTAGIPNATVLASIIPNPDDDGIIDLYWNDLVGATIYYVYRDVSPITSVTGLMAIAAVASNTYQDKITINGTYHYVVVAGNAAGNSSISNCENVTVEIFDAQSPTYSNAKEALSSPQTYVTNQRYQFNLTITDNIGMDAVLFEWNDTNYTVTTCAGDEYYHELVDLGAGTYPYRWCSTTRPTIGMRPPCDRT